jgi:hypothetical protein
MEEIISGFIKLILTIAVDDVNNFKDLMNSGLKGFLTGLLIEGNSCFKKLANDLLVREFKAIVISNEIEVFEALQEVLGPRPPLAMLIIYATQILKLEY